MLQIPILLPFFHPSSFILCGADDRRTLPTKTAPRARDWDGGDGIPSKLADDFFHPPTFPVSLFGQSHEQI